jgi:hypothetical protein
MLQDILATLEYDGYPDIRGYEDRIGYVFEVELEPGYESNFVRDLEHAVGVEGFSVMGDFDGIEVSKIGSSPYDGFEMYAVTLLFDLY